MTEDQVVTTGVDVTALSGLELRKAVATALGWTVSEDRGDGEFYRLNVGGLAPTIPHFESDGYGMLALINEMRRRGLDCTMQVHGRSADWMVGFAQGVEIDDKRPFFIEYARNASLPRAVAEAALSALTAVSETESLAAQSGMDTTVCEICEEPLDGLRKWRRGLDGAGAHESCLRRYL